jgi:hypothetical protein
MVGVQWEISYGGWDKDVMGGITNLRGRWA